MATDTFRRHTRACVDAATHCAFVALAHHPHQHQLFEQLLRVAHARSDLMATPLTRHSEVLQVATLYNMLAFAGSLLRDPEDWPGATGHPLRVIHSLASHLFGRYPTPRFLASAWLGGSTPDRVERRRWFVAHAQGQPFRTLALPLAMTRRMIHLFLSTPDHVPVDAALRRAEVLGLGGSAELAEVVLTTRLAEDFSDPDHWRRALSWLVTCRDTVDLTQVRPLVDFLAANLRAVDLRGRTFASALRLVNGWHGWLGRTSQRFVGWPRSRWAGWVVPVEPSRAESRRSEWTIVELLDNRELSSEGRAMRHCVASYANACANRRSAIWSLRHRWCDEGISRSVLTIEVRTDVGCIVQVRGKANARPNGWPLELVRRWAAREGLRFHEALGVGDGAELRQAA